MTATLNPPPPPSTRTEPRPSPWKRRGVRQAWIVGGSIMTAIALAATLVQVVSGVARETFVVEETIPAADLDGVRIVQVENDRGSVNLVGTDADDVELTTEVTRGLRSPTHGWRIDGDRLVIESRCPNFIDQFCDVDHDIQVPREMEVVLDVQEGRTVASDVDGPLEARVDRGDMELIRISGPVTARVHHGALRASQISAPTLAADISHGRLEIAFAWTPTRVTIDSQFADVDVSVPDEPGTYAVSVETQFGNTTNALRTDPRSASSIEVTSEFGRVTLGYTP